jgi:glycosyltransferase involved in cell wall biosynthesis
MIKNLKELNLILIPELSIIIPVYNGAGTIKHALESCLSQTYTNYEIIIIDNGSTDNTENIVRSFNSDKINYYYTDIKGRSNARNLGLEKARGKWIQFLDADDALEENKLTKALSILNSNTTWQAVQCATEYIKDDQVINVLEPYNKDDVYENLLLGNTIPINSIILSKSKCALFPEEMEHCEDWVFWIESLIDCNIYFDLKYRGAKVHIHEGNTMKDIQKMKFYELEVLLRYKNKKISFKKSVLREIKILKRFSEYLLFAGEKNNYIENETKRNLYLRNIRRICRVSFIKSYLKKKIGETNDKNVYQ